MELRHLRVLVEIARTGSYSAAAKALGYSQPAASQQMRALEGVSGTKLVVRAGRQIRLTEAGEALARHATTILAAVKVAEDEVASIAGLRSGRVRVSAFPSGSAALVPAAIAAAKTTHPGLRVSLCEQEPPESVASLRRGESDIALTFTYDGSHELDDPDLHCLALLEDPLLAILPSDHRLRSAPWVRIEDLGREEWIAGCERCRSNLVHVCTNVGFEPDIRFATDDNAAAQSLVAAGLGVALMPRLVLSAVRHDGLVVKPITPHSTRRIIAVTWPDLCRVPAVAAVLDALVAVSMHSQRLLLPDEQPLDKA